MFDTIFKNGCIVNQDGLFEGSVGVKDGLIVALGDLAASTAHTEVDCRGLHILPGVIDTQVHFREPGSEHKEDLQTGSKAAVLGGVTAVFEMPNTNPATSTAEAFKDKIQRATNRMHCDFAFYFGGTRENIDFLSQAEKLPGCAGIKVFIGSSTGTLLIDDEASLDRVLAVLSRRSAYHCEDEARLRARLGLRGEGDVRTHPLWRDEEAALSSTQRLVRLARKHGRPVHVLHVSTCQEMDFLIEHKDIASVEVTPHHLTLDDSVYQSLGTYAQMNPPVRSKRHQQALWQAINNGVVDILGSDHAPHTREEKDKPYPQSPSGMTGVQTLVPIMLDHVNKGRLSLQRFVDLTSAGAQRLFRIVRKGRIAAGYDADLTIVDLKKSVVIDNAMMASKAGWTPYHGKRVTGWPIGTVIRGKRVMWEDELVTSHAGAPLGFECAG